MRDPKYVFVYAFRCTSSEHYCRVVNRMRMETRGNRVGFQGFSCMNYMDVYLDPYPRHYKLQFEFKSPGHARYFARRWQRNGLTLIEAA